MGSIYKYNGSSPYKLEKIYVNKSIKTVKMISKIYMINIWVPYRHPYIYKLNSADKETHRVKIGTKINKHEILAVTGCTWVDH